MAGVFISAVILASQRYGSEEKAGVSKRAPSADHVEVDTLMSLPEHGRVTHRAPGNVSQSFLYYFHSGVGSSS